LLADFIFVTRPHTKPSLPSKDDLLAFIGQQSGKIGTREVARAFGLKNADRAILKRMLRELADEGLIERRRKKLHHPGTLPPVVLSDITARDLAGADLAGLLADEGEKVVFGWKGRLGLGTGHENKIREQNSLTS
jgi:ribonuclease R